MPLIHIRLPYPLILKTINKNSAKSTVSTSSIVTLPIGWLNVSVATNLYNATLLNRPAALNTGGYVSSYEAGYLLDIEADNVCTTVTYLLHSINMALLQLHPELTVKLRCCSRIPVKFRWVDVSWSNKKNKVAKVVAVLEIQQIYSMCYKVFK